MNERKSAVVRKKRFTNLMKTIRLNPQKGLNEFYERYSRMIHTTAQLICRSADAINEVVNHVLVKIWKLAQTYNKDIENPEGWLYTITLNTAKDAVREKYLYPLDEDILFKEDKIQEVVDNNSFYWMIQDLPEDEQKIIILKFVSRYTFNEIASEMNKPPGTVTSVYYRALGKIRTKLENKK